MLGSRKSILDYGCQAKRDGYITLVWPNGSLRDIDWVDGSKTSKYSAFGKLGDGYGSLQLVGREGLEVQAVKIYMGNWVHTLKGSVTPPKAPAAEAKNHWYTKHKMMLERVMTIMSGVQEWELEGLRVEMRLSGCTNEERAEEQRFLQTILRRRLSPKI